MRSLASFQVSFLGVQRTHSPLPASATPGRPMGVVMPRPRASHPRPLRVDVGAPPRHPAVRPRSPPAQLVPSTPHGKSAAGRPLLFVCDDTPVGVHEDPVAITVFASRDVIVLALLLDAYDVAAG